MLLRFKNVFLDLFQFRLCRFIEHKSLCEAVVNICPTLPGVYNGVVPIVHLSPVDVRAPACNSRVFVTSI